MAIVDLENFTPDHPTSRAQSKTLAVRSEIFARAGFRKLPHANIIDWTQVKVFYAILGEDIEGNSTPLNYRGLGRMGYWRDSRSGDLPDAVDESSNQEKVEGDDA